MVSFLQVLLDSDITAELHIRKYKNTTETGAFGNTQKTKIKDKITVFKGISRVVTRLFGGT
jgi:hypothetical protein